MKILGRNFRKMNASDYDCFAGASEGCFISDDVAPCLIWNPENSVLSEIGDPDSDDFQQRDWSFEIVC